MNAYKEIEKITDFQLQQLKIILDQLPLFEIVDRTATKLIVRQEAKNCISMKELIKDWEMVSEDDSGLITFHKVSASDKTYEDRLHDD
jgi:hypothetical protein